MPFLESTQSTKSRLNLSGVSMPVIVGIVALFIVSCVLMVQNMSYVLGEGDLTITQGDAVQSSLSGEESEGATENDEDALAANSEGASSSESDEQASPDAVGEVTVYVSGCVVDPGVYSLASDARVDDAVNAAGGFAEGAATDAVNLARAIEDGEQIDIPTEEEVEAGEVSDYVTSAVPPTGTGAGAADSGLVNINTADAGQLQSLPGIGEVTAEKIIASREEEGPFLSPEDIKRVSGIGEKKYEELADKITV